jgi:multicomponent Na+:H+ antiporter subunit D
MLRMVFTVFSSSFLLLTPADDLFLLLGMFGVIIASVTAIYQHDVKRLLAYSSIAQIGYMVLGMGFSSVLGVTATIVHVFNHALMKGALFMAVGALVYRVGTSSLDGLQGLGRQMPWTFGAIFIAGLSLIGLPGTAGFISKWYLVLAALEQQAWLIVVVILGGSLLAVIYMWKLVETLFFAPAMETSTRVREAPLSLLVPTWLLVLANIYFGIHTGLTVNVAGQAVEMLEVIAK